MSPSSTSFRCVSEALSHPTPGEDGHYNITFSEIFHSVTSEEHRPSFKNPSVSTKSRVKRKLPFYATVQHVKNSQIMVECSECNMWRIIFSKYKLKKDQRAYLQALLEKYMYSCGASLKDLDLPEEYNDIDIRDHDCYDPIEKLYYSAKNPPICIYCAKDHPYTCSDKYPECNDCEAEGKPVILRKK